MKTNNQEGSSFTESLITIVVAGIACVAFISVVASLVRETKNREVNDKMSEYAFEGLSLTRLNSSYGLSDTVINNLEKGMGCNCKMHDDDIVPLDVGADDCTGEGGECELLDLSVEGDEFFYRKVDLQLEGAFENGIAKVTVEVGRISPTGNDSLDKYSIDGFISIK